MCGKLLQSIVYEVQYKCTISVVPPIYCAILLIYIMRLQTDRQTHNLAVMHVGLVLTCPNQQTWACCVMLSVLTIYKFTQSITSLQWLKWYQGWSLPQILLYSRLVGNIWMRSSSILVYHHFTLNSPTILNTVTMQPGPWHMLLIRPLMVMCMQLYVCVWVSEKESASVCSRCSIL